MRSIRGYSEPDEVEFVGAPQTIAADGSIIETIVGFRRIMTAVFGVVGTSAERSFLFGFALSTERWGVMSPMGSIVLMIEDVSGFANEWKRGMVQARAYSLRLRESTIHTAWPSYVDPTETETLYICSHVPITGTPDSPQTLTTNAGALATDDTGNAYPAINLAAYAVAILVEPEQESECYYVGETLAQSGTDITFQVAHSYAGNAYSDGNHYATITLGLQAK